MRVFRALLLLISVAAIAGCATSYIVDTDYDQEYSFQNKMRFALKTPRQQIGIPQDLINQRVESSITRALTDRGYRQVEKDEADLLISYFFTTENRQEIIDYHDYWGYYGPYWHRPGYGMGIQRSYVHNYREGTLIIDIIDAETRTIKWRGATSTRLHHISPEEKDQLIKEVVTAILAKFPPLEI